MIFPWVWLFLVKFHDFFRLLGSLEDRMHPFLPCILSPLPLRTHNPSSSGACINMLFVCVPSDNPSMRVNWVPPSLFPPSLSLLPTLPPLLPSPPLPLPHVPTIPPPVELVSTCCLFVLPPTIPPCGSTGSTSWSIWIMQRKKKQFFYFLYKKISRSKQHCQWTKCVFQ